VGKSTYSALVGKHFKIPSVSAGELLRQEVKKGTALGKKVKPYIDKGLLVPHIITDALLIQRFKQSDCKKGFILNGILSPSERSDLLHRHIKIDYVIYFKAPKKTLLKRIAGRKGRSDSTPRVVELRYQAYKKRNSKLRGIYNKQGILTVIDARPPIDEVVERIIDVIDENR